MTQGLRAPPSGPLQALTCALFPLAAAGSSPLFGAALLFDVAAVAVGQAGVRGAGGWPARYSSSLPTSAARTAPTCTPPRHSVRAGPPEMS